jgi:hypothetical protein
MRDTLIQELESFEADVTRGGRTVLEGGTDFGHADIAVSCALAYWLSDHRSIGSHVGTKELRGYW